MNIALSGIMGRHPYGGVAWCSLMYLVGLRRLGHRVWYLEDTGVLIGAWITAERRKAVLSSRNALVPTIVAAAGTAAVLLLGAHLSGGP